MNTWVDRLTLVAELMTIQEFRIILDRTDVTCERCGNCCTSTAGRCKYLLGEKIFSCQLHPDKPTHCLEFPKVWNFEWMRGWNLGKPAQTLAFCGILRKFWKQAFEYMKEQGHVTE